MFELIFLKILLQISIFLLQTVPKCYTSIQYTVKNLVKMIFKPPSPKKLLFLIRPNPKKFQICNGDIYEIWLTLLCETMTYFSPSVYNGPCWISIEKDCMPPVTTNFPSGAEKSPYIAMAELIRLMELFKEYLS